MCPGSLQDELVERYARALDSLADCNRRPEARGDNVCRITLKVGANRTSADVEVDLGGSVSGVNVYWPKYLSKLFKSLGQKLEMFDGFCIGSVVEPLAERDSRGCKFFKREVFGEIHAILITVIVESLELPLELKAIDPSTPALSFAEILMFPTGDVIIPDREIGAPCVSCKPAVLKNALAITVVPSHNFTLTVPAAEAFL
jgi:hypothetical protein